MSKIEVCQQFINTPHNLFNILSKSDNLLIFCIAKNGLNPRMIELRKEIPTGKRYYKALKQLKDAGLIAKSPKDRGTYTHTTYGSIVYQRQIVEMAAYTQHLEKMKMIDTLRQTNKYSEKDIQKFVEDVININVGYGKSPPSSFAYRMVWSFEDLVSSIVEKIGNCNTEILVATRLAPEGLINEIIHKSKMGVKVKVLADTKLVQGYKSQTLSLGFDNNINSSDNDNYKTDKKNENERIQVVGNPWYPNDEGIQRRICDIPFGLMIVDGMDVCIELIDRNKTQNFFGGIFLKDESLATSFKELYQKIWDAAPANDPLNNINTIKQN